MSHFWGGQHKSLKGRLSGRGQDTSEEGEAKLHNLSGRQRLSPHGSRKPGGRGRGSVEARPGQARPRLCRVFLR